MPWTPKFLFATTLAVLGLLLPVHQAMAQEISEYQLKAVLFYRLTHFVYWPENKEIPRPTHLCIVGTDPFGQSLRQIDGGKQDTRIVINPDDLSICQLLFIARSETERLALWLSRAKARPLLTVSDIPGFARAGGMIELPLEAGRVAIVVNRRASEAQGFGFNAQLLRLARVVDG